MYLRTVLRSMPSRRAMAVGLSPCRCRSRIMTTSPKRTTTPLPQTLGTASVAALCVPARASPGRHAQRNEVGNFSRPLLGRIQRTATHGGRLTSDAGVLLLAEVERRLGVAERLAQCIGDPRDPAAVRHSLAEMIRFRALLIACGYPVLGVVHQIAKRCK